MQTVFQLKASDNPLFWQENSAKKGKGVLMLGPSRPRQTGRTEMTTGPGLAPASGETLEQAALHINTLHRSRSAWPASGRATGLLLHQHVLASASKWPSCVH